MEGALVIYESMFGNTRTVAEGIAEGCRSAGFATSLVEVSLAPTRIPDDVALVIVGGPTHAFGLTRPRTRQDAARQADGGLVSSGDGLREWLEGVGPPSAGVRAAAFDTRIDKPRVPGSAARGAERRLRRLGFGGLAPAESFYVTGTKGPLLEGERARAGRWGEAIALKARAAATAHP